MRYIPHPANTDHIQLPADLVELTEQIAENVHEVWAASRMAEGWTLGAQRDDVAKTTPCLVPYDRLPEIEKEYDRNTAMSTLKFILSLGYRITKDV